MSKIDKNKVKRFRRIFKWLMEQGKPILLPITLVSIIGAVNSIVTVSVAVVSKNMIDAAMSKNLDKVLTMGWIFAAIVIGEILLSSLRTLISVKAGESIANNMRIRLFKNVVRGDWTKVSTYHSGDILTRMTSDVGTVTSGFIGLIPGIIALSVQLIAAFTTLMFYEPKLALLAFFITPLAIIFSKVFVGRLGRLHRSIQETESNYRSYMHEAVQNIMVIKVFGLAKNSTEKINSIQNERFGLVMKRSWLSLFAGGVMSIGYGTGYFLAFVWGAIGLTKGTLSFGTMTAFLQLVGQIQSPFSGLASSLPQIISVVVSAERLMEIENIDHEDASDEYVTINKVGVIFENVSFAYKAEGHVLNDVSFNIKPGEIIGVVGHSGEGKTTLIRMLMALIKPQSGRAYFTDEDSKRLEISAAMRKLISYVPQGNTLFSGTIYENILTGNLDASEKEVVSAAIDACALDFIESLPEAINTKIGEKAFGISEGQAQRVAIARALVRKSPLLILDEATSALDSDTEVKVLKAIKGLNHSCTCILITHRESALSICDRVFKIDGGKMFEK